MANNDGLWQDDEDEAVAFLLPLASASFVMVTDGLPVGGLGIEDGFSTCTSGLLLALGIMAEGFRLCVMLLLILACCGAFLLDTVSPTLDLAEAESGGG